MTSLPLKATLGLITALILTSCATGPAALTYQTTTNGVQSLSLQNTLTPDQTLTRLEVPEGFSVRIFASEPDITNPIALTWDERGRLWVLESTNYPHENIGAATGGDRITICEDTNGDGKADVFKRFAEDQPLSTSIAVVKGGVIVGQAPDMVFMADTDGDDKMDEKTVLIDDTFGTFDTHAVMNNMKYGIDNHMWSAVGYSGIYERGQAPEIEDRTRQKERILPQGVFRFTLDGAELEPIGHFNNNTWGLGIGEDNTIFGSTANNNHAVVVGIPMRYGAAMNVANVQSHYIIEHASERQLQQVDWRDGYTAAAGAFVYAGRRYPQKYWGNLLVTEPTGHVLHTVPMEPDGAIFKEKANVVENLLASSDEWVAPVFADIGPDENVWVADWHNPVIQHNPDGRNMRNQIWSAERGRGNAHLNPLRDKDHGRIYVIEYAGRAGDDISSLSADDADGLVRGLRSTNQFWRLTAQRLIVENQVSGVGPELVAMIKDQSVDATGINAPAIHALWTLHGLGMIDSEIETVKAALSHPSAGVRKAAVQVLPDGQVATTLRISGLLTDENLNTRMAAVLRGLDVQPGEAGKPLVSAAMAGGDDWINAAIAMTDPPPPPPVEAEEPEEDGMMASLTINAAPAAMVYQQKTLQAYAGQTLEFRFNNFNTELHNVVLLKAGVSADEFGQALAAYMTSADAEENHYIPEAQRENVIAVSETLESQGSQTFRVDGLPAGEYVYICTIPGHWQLMQGVLVVEEL